MSQVRYPFNILILTSASFLPQAKNAVEEVFQKKTHLEHILLRPDTYIGTSQSSEKAFDPKAVSRKRGESILHNMGPRQ